MAPKKKYLEAYETAVQNGVRAGRKALKEIRVAPSLKSVWTEAKTRGEKAAGVARRQARSAEAELSKRQAQFAKRLESARREAGPRPEKSSTGLVPAPR